MAFACRAAGALAIVAAGAGGVAFAYPSALNIMPTAEVLEAGVRRR
ncbi:MAG: hypothetical protein ACE5R4_09300 [Armatimonadota bacterium]